MADTYMETLQENLEVLMEATGLIWTIEDTGGGCTAFMMTVAHDDPETFYLVTIADDAEAPTCEEDWQNIALGYYSPDLDGDGFIMHDHVQTLGDIAEFFSNRGQR